VFPQEFVGAITKKDESAAYLSPREWGDALDFEDEIQKFREEHRWELLWIDLLNKAHSSRDLATFRTYYHAAH
jgi:hypothetical protein